MRFHGACERQVVRNQLAKLLSGWLIGHPSINHLPELSATKAIRHVSPAGTSTVSSQNGFQPSSKRSSKRTLWPCKWTQQAAAPWLIGYEASQGGVGLTSQVEPGRLAGGGCHVEYQIHTVAGAEDKAAVAQGERLRRLAVNGHHGCIRHVEPHRCDARARRIDQPQPHTSIRAN